MIKLSVNLSQILLIKNTRWDSFTSNPFFDIEKYIANKKIKRLKDRL